VLVNPAPVSKVAAKHRQPRVGAGRGVLGQEARGRRLDRVEAGPRTGGDDQAGARVVQRVRHARVDEQLVPGGPAGHGQSLGGEGLEQPLGDVPRAGAAVVVGVVDPHQHVGGREGAGLTAHPWSGTAAPRRPSRAPGAPPQVSSDNSMPPD
jgi:hypothetical protein